MEIRQPCGYALTVVKFGTQEVLKFELKRGENVMKELIASLESLAKQMYLEKRKHYTFTGEASYTREEAYTCWICETEFGDNDQVVLDHCHHTNKFLGWAHNECNINRKTADYIPVIAHKLSSYDLHFIIKALSNRDPENTYSVIPSTEEKNISLTMSVYNKHGKIKIYTDKHGKIKQVYENQRFIDSYKFMLSPLSKLVENLPEEQFFLLENYFADLGYSAEQINSYFDSFAKFRETQLPPQRLWNNTLQGGEVIVSKNQYNHAVKGYAEKRFARRVPRCVLATDVLLLASVFEAFREVCYET